MNSYLSEHIAERAIKLRSELPIKLPDAVIAATALVLRVPLLTRNHRDFQKIPNLTLPWNLHLYKVWVVSWRFHCV
ncbi:MAG TPA: PIN domain-containing protein [Candidatus Lambdaproteobacteria bacterium]|nr:PIN domain-containing protein [Candidatus Lambdaproteobacteria bacterium]